MLGQVIFSYTSVSFTATHSKKQSLFEAVYNSTKRFFCVRGHCHSATAIRGLYFSLNSEIPFQLRSGERLKCRRRSTLNL